MKCSTALEIERGLKRSHACKVAKKNRKKESFGKKCTSKVDNFFFSLARRIKKIVTMGSDMK